MVKKAQFEVDIIGIPKIKRQVKDYADEYLRQEAKMTKQVEREHAARERSLNKLFRDQERMQERASRAIEKAQQKALKQQERAEKQAAHLVEQQEKRKQQAIRETLKLGGLMAQAGGFYKTGYVLRAASHLGIGSNLLGGGEGAVAGEAIAGLGAAAAGVGVAFGGLVVASKLVEVGFQGASKVVGDFLGALAQIGGAKNLQAMIVESVSNVKLANQARFSVGPQERMSSAALQGMAQRLSTNAAAGAFSQADWLKALNTIGTLSGKQSSLTPSTLQFIGGYANVHGISVEEASDVYARLQAQNPSWNNGQVQQALLAAFGAGQTLSFNPSELPQANTLMRQTAFLSGDSQANLQKLMVAGGLIKPGAGGLQNAGIYMQNLIKGFREKGVTNLDTMLEQVVSHPMSQLPLNNIRGQNAAALLQAQLSERAGVSKDDFSQKANEARLKELRSLEGVTMTQKEFQKAVQDSITPQEKLEATVHDLENRLEAKLLPIVEELIPVFKDLATVLVDNKDNIKFALELMIGAIKATVDPLVGFAELLETLMYAIRHPGTSIESLNAGVIPPELKKQLEDLENLKHDVLNPHKDAPGSAAASATGAGEIAKPKEVKLDNETHHTLNDQLTVQKALLEENKRLNKLLQQRLHPGADHARN